MLSKLSIFLVASAALLSLAIAVHGQDDATPSNSLWPFGRLPSLFHNSDSNSNSNGDGSSNPSPSQHTTIAQSDSNRRLYGPSLAVRPGVADGYAPPNMAPGSLAPRAAAKDMQPVISQGTAITNRYATDPAYNTPATATPPAHTPPAAAPRNYNGYEYTPPQTDTTDNATPRDSRPLSDRLAAIRQSSLGDRPTAVATDSDAIPVAPPVKTGASSRRVISGDDDAPGSVADSAAPAAPNQAASIEPNDRLDVVAGSDTPKPEALKPHSVKPEFTPLSSRREADKTAKAESNSSASGSVLFSRQSPLVTVETTGPRTIVLGKEANYVVTIKNSGDVGARPLGYGENSRLDRRGRRRPARGRPASRRPMPTSRFNGSCRGWQLTAKRPSRCTCCRARARPSIWPCNGPSRLWPHKRWSRCKSRNSI